MRVRHTIVAVLTGALLFQSVVLAQAPLAPTVQVVPRDKAIHFLLNNLRPGDEVRVRDSRGEELAGRFAEASDDELVIIVSGQRHVIPAADILGLRRPLPPRTNNGSAFGIGAGIGVLLLFGAVLIAGAAGGH